MTHLKLAPTVARTLARTLASTLILGAMAAACAPVADRDTSAMAATSPRQCFSNNEVRGFTVPKRDTLHLQVGRNRSFEVEAFGACRELDDALGITLIPDIGMNHICTGDTARVLTHGGPDNLIPCRVRIVRQVVEPAKDGADTPGEA